MLSIITLYTFFGVLSFGTLGPLSIYKILSFATAFISISYSSLSLLSCFISIELFSSEKWKTSGIFIWEGRIVPSYYTVIIGWGARNEKYRKSIWESWIYSGSSISDTSSKLWPHKITFHPFFIFISTSIFSDFFVKWPIWTNPDLFVYFHFPRTPSSQPSRIKKLLSTYFISSSIPNSNFQRPFIGNFRENVSAPILSFSGFTTFTLVKVN